VTNRKKNHDWVPGARLGLGAIVFGFACSADLMPICDDNPCSRCVVPERALESPS